MANLRSPPHLAILEGMKLIKSDGVASLMLKIDIYHQFEVNHQQHGWSQGATMFAREVAVQEVP